jgi:hypothetical protein
MVYPAFAFVQRTLSAVACKYARRIREQALWVLFEHGLFSHLLAGTVVSKLDYSLRNISAERVGFEPTFALRRNTLSRRAQSAALPPLQFSCRFSVVSCQSTFVCCRFSVVSCQSKFVCCRFSVVSCQSKLVIQFSVISKY